MGAEPGDNTYDEDKIFYHLVFYIDTPETAEQNGLTASEASPDTQQR